MVRVERLWLIQGFDGLTRFFRAEVPVGLLTEDAAGTLLQRLASRHLTPNEVLAASLRRRTKGYSPLLEVVREPRERVILSVGSSPHFVATIMTRDELDDPNNA